MNIYLKFFMAILLLIGASRLFLSDTKGTKYQPSKEDLTNITGYSIDGKYQGKAFYRNGDREWTVDMEIADNKIKSIRWTYYRSEVSDSNVSWDDMGNVSFVSARTHDHGAGNIATYIHDTRVENGVLSLDYRKDSHAEDIEYLKLKYDLQGKIPDKHSSLGGVFVRSPQEGCVETKVVAEFPQIVNSGVIPREDMDIMLSNTRIRNTVWKAVKNDPEYKMQKQFEKMGISEVIGGIMKHAVLKDTEISRWSPHGMLRLDIEDVYLESKGRETRFVENDNTTYRISRFESAGYSVKVLMCREKMYALNLDRETRKYRDPESGSTRYEYLKYDLRKIE